VKQRRPLANLLNEWLAALNSGDEERASTYEDTVLWLLSETEDDDEEEEPRYCISCESSLGSKDRGPKCYPCYMESLEVIQHAHKQPMSYQDDEKSSRSRDVEKKKKSSFAHLQGSARAKKVVKRVLEREEDSDEPVAGVADDTPDLGAYFAFFKDFTELDQVVYCRAYATMLSTKSAKNRLRYSKKAGEKWANKG